MGLVNCSSVAVLLLTVGLHFAPALAGAQSLWLDRDHATTIRLEAHHVDIVITDEKLLTGVASLDFTSSVVGLSLAFFP